MNVLSLFDGMSCGRIALERVGIPVTNYFASEIDKHAMQVSKANWPEIKQLGSVTDLTGESLPEIDLLIGGSPCQGFSFAGKQLNFEDPRSKLFFEYVRLLKALKPKYFLLENVMMKKEYQDVISEQLGVQPVMICSSKFSAQMRKRLYWTNIPILPYEDKGIVLEDILEDQSPYIGRIVGRKINPETGCRDDYNQELPTVQRLEPRLDGKSGCLTTVAKDNVVLKIPVIKNHGELIYKPHKSQCLDANYWKGADNHGQRTGCIEVGHAEINGHDFLKRVYGIAGESPTLTAVCGGNQERKIAIDPIHWHKLTPIECERLQTVPDNYTACVSNSQRYRMLGNGWTVDVIAHIFKGLLK